MRFLIVVWRAAGQHRLRLCLALIASTIGSIGVLAVINVSIQVGGDHQRAVNVGGLLLFALSAVGVIAGQAIARRVSSQVIEDLLDRTRRRRVGAGPRRRAGGGLDGKAVARQQLQQQRLPAEFSRTRPHDRLPSPGFSTPVIPGPAPGGT